METDNNSSIFYDFTSRKEAMDFIESFENQHSEHEQEMSEERAKE